MYLKDQHKQDLFDYAHLESKVLRGPKNTGECNISLMLYSDKVAAPRRVFNTQLLLSRLLLSYFGGSQQIAVLDDRKKGWQSLGPFDIYSHSGVDQYYRVAIRAFRQNGNAEVQTAVDNLVFSDGCERYFLSMSLSVCPVCLLCH